MNETAYIQGYLAKEAAFNPQSAAVGGGIGMGVGGIAGLVLTKLLAKNPELQDYLLGGSAGAVAGGTAGVGLSQLDLAQKLSEIFELSEAGAEKQPVDREDWESGRKRYQKRMEDAGWAVKGRNKVRPHEILKKVYGDQYEQAIEDARKWKRAHPQSAALQQLSYDEPIPIRYDLEGKKTRGGAIQAQTFPAREYQKWYERLLPSLFPKRVEEAKISIDPDMRRTGNEAALARLVAHEARHQQQTAGRIGTKKQSAFGAASELQRRFQKGEELVKALESKPHQSKMFYDYFLKNPLEREVRLGHLKQLWYNMGGRIRDEEDAKLALETMFSRLDAAGETIPWEGLRDLKEWVWIYNKLTRRDRERLIDSLAKEMPGVARVVPQRQEGVPA